MTDVVELDQDGTLAALESTLLDRRGAEVDDLELLAHWAMLHGNPDTRNRARGKGNQRGGDRLVQVGGEGTPKVWQLAIAEAATARRVAPATCQRAIADVLDLQHRLPRTWAKVASLEAEVWVARQVAARTRDLTREQVAVVDAAVSAASAGQAPTRVLTICEAKIIEADPETHATKVEEQRRARYVRLGRTDEYGLRYVISRVEAGDAVWVDAMVDRVADILATRHTTGATGCPSRDELRAEAFGWLARPAELLQLLLEHQDTDGPTAHPADPTADSAQAAAGAPTAHDERSEDEHREDVGAAAQTTHAGAAEDETDVTETADAEIASFEPDPCDQPEPAPVDSEDASVPSRAFAFPADLLEALANAKAGALRPEGCLYVHLTPDSPVARVEGHGPVLADTALTWLFASTNVKVQPVIDLADRISVNAYEHPTRLKEHIWLREAGDYFPYAGGLSRNVDFDHPTPYDPTGPPGQTGTHNSGPLSRRHHRVKTHAPGWSSRQSGAGRYIWRTPQGRYYLVDQTGTRQLTADQGQMIHDAPLGVDIYTPDLGLEWVPAC